MWSPKSHPSHRSRVMPTGCVLAQVIFQGTLKCCIIWCLMGFHSLFITPQWSFAAEIVPHRRLEEICAGHLALRRSKGVQSGIKLQHLILQERKRISGLFGLSCHPLQSGCNLSFHPRGGFIFFPVELVMIPLEPLEWRFPYPVTCEIFH